MKWVDLSIDQYVYCADYKGDLLPAVVINLDQHEQIGVMFSDGTRVDWPLQQIHLFPRGVSEGARAAFDREARGRSRNEFSLSMRKARECIGEAKQSLRERGLFGKVKP